MSSVYLSPNLGFCKKTLGIPGGNAVISTQRENLQKSFVGQSSRHSGVDQAHSDRQVKFCSCVAVMSHSQWMSGGAVGGGQWNNRDYNTLSRAQRSLTWLSKKAKVHDLRVLVSWFDLSSDVVRTELTGRPQSSGPKLKIGTQSCAKRNIY